MRVRAITRRNSMRYITALFFWCVHLTQSTLAAPTLFVENGHYYEVVTQSGTWDQANAAAETRSYSGLPGKLASITSSAENTFISSTLGAFDAWLGGYQPDGSAEPDANWQWATGERWWSSWSPGEPNNHYAGGAGNLPFGTPEDATQLWPTGLWNDLPRAASLPRYVVEYARAPSFLSANGHYYELVVCGSGTTWDEARIAATQRTYFGMRGTLATATFSQENELLSILAGSTLAWLGGCQPDGSMEPAGNWQWVTGEPWAYTNWGGGEPNNYYAGGAGNLPFGTPEESLHLLPNGVWNDLPHNAVLNAYIVEYVPEPAALPLLAVGAAFAVGLRAWRSAFRRVNGDRHIYQTL
jgi:hypothetical protein